MGTVFILFLVFLFLGMPVAFAIAVSGLWFFVQTPELPYTIVVQRTISTSQSFTMLAVPLFIFAGHLMNSTGITPRLMKLASVLTGHMWGNLAQVSIVLSTLMSGVSGSAVADAAMQSRILGPAMEEKGYRKSYSAAVINVSSMVVATLPPSMGLILFGTLGEVSIGRLFIGGIVPGFMLMVAYMISTSITARRLGYAPENAKPPSLKEVAVGFVDGIWALIFPIILIVFIRFGIFTPSESGAFAAVYAILIGVFVYKELTFKKFLNTLLMSARDIGAIMLLISVSGVFGFGVIFDRLGPTLSEFLLNITTNPTALLFLIIIFLLGIGMLMESTVITLILTPIFVPIVRSVGIDPVHFGLVMMTITTLAQKTPPAGISLLAVSSILECKPEETAKDSLALYGATVIVVLLVVLFPSLVLFLPNLLFG